MQSRRKPAEILYATAIALAIAGALAAGTAAAQSEEPKSPGTVGLDRLLRLPPPNPENAADPPARYGGAGEAEWRARFDKARGDIESGEEALREARKKLSKISATSGQWQMAAPGLGGKSNESPQNSPVSYQLHQEIRRQREEIEHAEHRLQEVKVEAALAGVPEEWTRAPDAPRTPGAETASESDPP